MRTSRSLAILLSSLLLASLRVEAAAAQNTPTVSPTAQAEIGKVREATRRLTSMDTARATGFEPRLGWFPTMGVHWVSDARMNAGRAVKLSEPAHLMFSPIAGRDSLVGAAYAYFAPLTDSTRPPTFDGNPPWHDHPNLAPEGHTLAMLHVWFVPSPDGPFAGHNPNLPFWALGLTPPDPARMRDAAADTRIRKTALALGTVVDTVGLFPNIARREPMRSLLVAMRDSIRPLTAELDASQKAGDWARWDRAATRAAAYWDKIHDAYLAAAPTPQRRERMEHFMTEMVTGAHGGGAHRH